MFWHHVEMAFSIAMWDGISYKESIWFELVFVKRDGSTLVQPWSTSHELPGPLRKAGNTARCRYRPKPVWQFSFEGRSYKRSADNDSFRLIVYYYLIQNFPLKKACRQHGFPFVHGFDLVTFFFFLFPRTSWSSMNLLSSELPFNFLLIVSCFLLLTTKASIRRAYRKLALVTHPDRWQRVIELIEFGWIFVESSHVTLNASLNSTVLYTTHTLHICMHNMLSLR